MKVLATYTSDFVPDVYRSCTDDFEARTNTHLERRPQRIATATPKPKPENPFQLGIEIGRLFNGLGWDYTIDKR